jgi:flagellar biosynthesis/type III secretory pathway protein FliH
MLAKRTLSVGSLGEVLESMPTLIKSEDLGLINSYETFLLKKMSDADTIIDQAHENARHIARNAREQAEVEFWKQTQHIYCDMQQIKKALMVEIEEQCSNLVMECLKKLVDDIPPLEKIRPLIRAVLEQHNPEEPATLLVNPEQLTMINTMTPAPTIPLVADAGIDKDSVVLKTEKSQYESSFNGKLSALVKSLK